MNRNIEDFNKIFLDISATYLDICTKWNICIDASTNNSTSNTILDNDDIDSNIDSNIDNDITKLKFAMNDLAIQMQLFNFKLDSLILSDKPVKQIPYINLELPPVPTHPIAKPNMQNPTNPQLDNKQLDKIIDKTMNEMMPLFFLHLMNNDTTSILNNSTNPLINYMKNKLLPQQTQSPTSLPNTNTNTNTNTIGISDDINDLD